MRSLSNAEMREADRRCIEDIGIPSAVLMYNAGKAVFSEVVGEPVGVVCGKGNNGGDGFVVALLARIAGRGVRVVLLAAEADLKGDPAVYHGAYKRLGGTVQAVKGETGVREALAGLRDCSVLVDAILGTGISGEVHGDKRVAIDHWPGIATVAVDVPSGLNGDTGEPCGAAIHAATTVTFQFAKRGFDRPSAKEYLGRLVVADIGIPQSCAPAPGEVE